MKWQLLLPYLRLIKQEECFPNVCTVLECGHLFMPHFVHTASNTTTATELSCISSYETSKTGKEFLWGEVVEVFMVVNMKITLFCRWCCVVW